MTVPPDQQEGPWHGWGPWITTRDNRIIRQHEKTGQIIEFTLGSLNALEATIARLEAERDEARRLKELSDERIGYLEHAKLLDEAVKALDAWEAWEAMMILDAGDAWWNLQTREQNHELVQAQELRNAVKEAISRMQQGGAQG